MMMPVRGAPLKIPVNFKLTANGFTYKDLYKIHFIKDKLPWSFNQTVSGSLSAMQIIAANPAKPSVRQLFSYPFRIFFLSLTLIAIVFVPLWVLVATGVIRPPLAMPGILWHQHEMLFGFLSAAIAGFLLTAVCVWTNTERTHGARLLGLWLVWLAGRLLLLLGGGLPDLLVQVVNLAFLPLVMLDAGWRVWQARQRRQLVILVILGLLWSMQIAFVVTLSAKFIAGGLIMAMALSGIIGGRITPAFSTGWLRQQGRDPSVIRVIPRLDLLAVLSMVAVLAFKLAELNVATGAASFAAAVFMLARLVGWRGWLVARNPLLWILHVSLLWIPVSLVLLAGYHLLGWPASAWGHAAGLGVVGSLVLGVVARVALGHTGRPLALPPGMVTAFIAIQLAALVRVTTAFGGIDWVLGVRMSGALWVLAFTLFLVRYTGILMKPRFDGREG